MTGEPVQQAALDALDNLVCPTCQGFFDGTDIVAAIPGAFTLYAGPLACMRFSVVGSVTPGNRQKAAYLVLSENDIVLGRIEDCIADAVDEIVRERGIKPSLLVVLLACDAILTGLDGDALTRRIEAQHPGMHVRPIMVGGLDSNDAQTFVGALREACRGVVDDGFMDALVEAVTKGFRR